MEYVSRSDTEMLFRFHCELKKIWEKSWDNPLKMQHFCQMLVWHGGRMHGMCFFSTPESWETPSIPYTAGLSWAFLLGFGCMMILCIYLFFWKRGGGRGTDNNKRICRKCRKLPKQTSRGKRLLRRWDGRLCRSKWGRAECLYEDGIWKGHHLALKVNTLRSVYWSYCPFIVPLCKSSSWTINTETHTIKDQMLNFLQWP